MKITFDAAKRAKTLADRGLDFAGAGKVFVGRCHTFEDTRFSYSEPRFVTAGFSEGRMLIIVWTPTTDGRRVISMRKANVKEQARYAHHFG